MRAAVVGALVLFSAVSCSKARSPTTSQRASPLPMLTGWVLDADGPVADASVRLVALPQGDCPCSAGETLEQFGNEDPTCICPRALERWLERVDRCGQETRVLLHTKSDAKGRVEIPLQAQATAIEVSRPQALAWVALPETTREIALELQPVQMPEVTLSLPAGNADIPGLRGAVLFQDGHCVPLAKQGDIWRPTEPVTHASDDEAVVLFDAPGYAPAIASWYGGLDTVALSLGRYDISDVCADAAADATVTYQTPYFYARTTTDARGRFSFRGVPHRPARVECRRGEEVLAQWWFEPDQGLLGTIWDDADEPSGPDAHGWKPGQDYAHCYLIEVVDANGKAVEGAEVDHWATRQRGTTDIHGRTCMIGLLLPFGGKISVRAPAVLGGHHAGEIDTVIAPWSPTSGKPPQTRVRLKIDPVRRTAFRGRLVSPEGLPVAGGHVHLGEVFLARTPDAGSVYFGRWTTTEPDGTFDFGVIPTGTAGLHIHHPWYVDRTLKAPVSKKVEDFALERGANWHGKVLDPEGKPIENCRAILQQPPSQRLFISKCPEFSFRGLAAGPTELRVKLEDHPVLATRVLTLQAELKKAEARKADVRWPAGSTIAGGVVDESGHPRARVEVWVSPKDRRSPGPHRFETGRVSLRTDAQGRFSFRHLEPGRWVLGGYPEPEEELVLETGTTDVRVIVWK